MSYILVIFLSCLFLYFTASVLNRKSYKIYLFITFSILMAGHVFIDPLSVPDLPAYSELYSELQDISLFSIKDMIYLNAFYSMEWGYLLFTKICTLFTNYFNSFLIIVNFIILSAYYETIRRYSSNILLSIVLVILTIYVQSYFVLRQHVAIAVLLLSYKPILEQNLKRFLFILLIAISIHKSAIIWFPIYFIYNIKSNKKFISVLVIYTFILVLGFTFMSDISNALFVGYGTYIEGEKSGSANYTEFCIAVIFLSTYMYFCGKKLIIKGFNRLIFTAFYINTIMSLVGVNLGILTRFKLYFYVPLIFLIPETAKSIKDKYIRSIYIIGVISGLGALTFMGNSIVDNFKEIKYLSINISILFFYFLSILFYLLILKKSYREKI